MVNKHFFYCSNNFNIFLNNSTIKIKIYASLNFEYNEFILLIMTLSH
jgi:hypothetical protein